MYIDLTWYRSDKSVDPQLNPLICRQAALEALQTVLEAFSQEDHFEAVAGPLLATPLQHTQAAASTSGQVSPSTLALRSIAFHACMRACLLTCLLACLQTAANSCPGTQLGRFSYNFVPYEALFKLAQDEVSMPGNICSNLLEGV